MATAESRENIGIAKENNSTSCENITVSAGNKALPYKQWCIIILWNNNLMTFGSREEMELYVIELYKQGKTIGEIAQIVRMSYIRDWWTDKINWLERFVVLGVIIELILGSHIVISVA